MAFNIFGAVAATQFSGDAASITGLSSGYEIGSTTVAVDAPDSNWLPCNGAPVAQAAYPELFAVIGQLGNFSALPELPLPIPAVMYPVAYQNNLWWVTGTSRLFSSADGTTWTERTGNLPAVAHTTLAYGAGVTVVSSSSGVYSTSDYTTWTNRTTAVNKIVFANGMFVGVGSNRIITSTDGLTWTVRTPSPAYTETLQDVAWSSIGGGNGVWMAVGNAGGWIRSTDNGATWTTGTTLGTRAILSLTVSQVDNEFILLEDKNTVGSVHTCQVYKTASGTSPAGTGTIPHNSSVGKQYKILYVEGKFFSFSDTNKIFSSSDLTTWTLLSIPVTTTVTVGPSLNKVAQSSSGVMLGTTAQVYLIGVQTFNESTHFAIPYVPTSRDGLETYIKVT